MKKHLLLITLALASTLAPVLAQTLTNVSVTVVAPPTVHAVVIPHALTQLDASAPAGKRAFVSGGVIAPDGSLTLTITYR